MAKGHPQQLREAIVAELAHDDNKNPWLVADKALDAIFNGWAKVDGEWVQIEAGEVVTDEHGISLRWEPFADGSTWRLV